MTKQKPLNKKIIGYILIFTGALGLVISLGGLVMGLKTIDALGLGLENSLILAQDTLTTTEQSLTQIQTTVQETQNALTSAATAAQSAGKAIGDTEPLLGQISTAVSKDAPAAIQSVEEGLPTLAETANTVDDTLKKLSDFKINQSFLGFNLAFDLGIDYKPDVPLAETVNKLGSNLGELSSNLSALEQEFSATQSNVAVVGEDIEAVAADLETINASLSEFAPLFAQYNQSVKSAQQQIQTIQAGLSKQLNAAKAGLVLAMIWLGLMQIVPFYLGWELASGGRESALGQLENPAS